MCHAGTDRQKADFAQTLRRRVGDGSEITALVMDGSQTSGRTPRVALGMRSGIVQVWDIDSAGDAKPVFSVKIPSTVPAGLAFAGTDTRDLYICSMFDGKMYVRASLKLQYIHNDAASHTLNASGQIMKTKSIDRPM